MQAEAENITLFEAEKMFTKCRFCKMYQLTGERTSGDTLHCHDYMQIWYVVKGSCQHWVEGKLHHIEGGEAFILPPQMDHWTLLDEKTEVIGCEFLIDDLLNIVEDSLYSRVKDSILDFSFIHYYLKKHKDGTPRFSINMTTRFMVERLMLEMLEEYNSERKYYEEFLRLHILELLLLFSREYAQIREEHPSISKYDKYISSVDVAIQYVEDHYSEPISLDKICKIAMVSRTYFCYLFKSYTKKTFTEYLLNKRVDKAIELMPNESKSLTEIAGEVGFSDSANFSRTFKKTVGISPRSYRMMCRAEGGRKILNTS